MRARQRQAQVDHSANVSNMVPEEPPVKLPTIKERAKQYTGKAKEIYENGFDGNDILTYDENMAKVYNAASHGETLRAAMTNDPGFYDFFNTHDTTVMSFYGAVYKDVAKARNAAGETETDSQTLGGNDYGDLHNDDEVRDEGAVRQPVEVREGDLGGSHPVRTEEVTADDAGQKPVSDLEEVGGSDVRPVSGSSGRGISGSRGTGSSAGDQVPDHVGGITPTDTTQSDRFTVKYVDGAYYVWDNSEGRTISSAYPVHESADRVLDGIRDSKSLDRYSVKKMGDHEYYIWDNENDVAVSKRYPVENLAKFVLDERRIEESKNNKVSDSGEKVAESAQDHTENAQKDTGNVQNGTENAHVAPDNDRNITESAQKTEQNVPK